METLDAAWGTIPKLLAVIILCFVMAFAARVGWDVGGIVFGVEYWGCGS